MKKLITLLLLLTGFVAACQTNGTFNNLDVRNRATHRGYTYMYDSVFFKPLSANIPYKSLADSVGWVLSTSNGAEAQLVRISMQTFADSISTMIGGYWYLSGDTIIQIDENKVYLTDSIYIDRYAIPEIQPGDPVSGQVLVMRKLSPNPIGQLARVPIDMLIDSLQYFGINYWTFVDAATDTLKNNVAIGDSPGVVAIDGNLELQTTKADGTEGIVKQNGVNLLHTYHEKGDNNLFLGQGAGNFTADSSFNIGIGISTLSALTTGFDNVSIGRLAMKNTTTGYNNIAVGSLALSETLTASNNTAVGYESMRYTNNVNNTAVGYQSLRGSLTLSSNTGSGNVSVGNLSMVNYTSASNNVCIGVQSGNAITTAGNNVYVGSNSASNSTIGDDNVGIGYWSLYGNVQGIRNTAVGSGALRSNGDNDGSTAVGYQAMYYADSRTTGERVTYNTAVGYEAMKGSSTAANNTGQYNTAVGYQALDAMTSGSYNSIFGVGAGGGITSGSKNTVIGYNALNSLTVNDANTVIGYNAGYNLMGSSLNSILMGNNAGATDTNIRYSVLIGEEAGTESDSIFYSIGLGRDVNAWSQNSQYVVAIGEQANRYSINSYKLTAIGYLAGDNVLDVRNSLFMGNEVGSFASNVDSSIFIGINAGNGSQNIKNSVFIGTQAGYGFTNKSNLLVIENTNSTDPLVWGDFGTDSLRFNGNVAFVHDIWYEDTYWRDATTSATALAPGVNAPSQRTIVGGIKGMGYAPSTQNDISYGQVQLNHDYKFDTDLKAHMHFMIEETAEAGDTAVFALEYSWADINEAFPVSDTLVVLIPCAAITAKEHKLVSFGDITGPGGNNVSSSIIFRLERLQDNVHDTYDGANEYVIVLDVDYHLEIDAPGSRQDIYK